jgi:glycine cleavage system H protein
VFVSAGLWYWTADQTWAAPQPNGLIRLGITPLGLKASGELYMCRPKSVGSELEQGRSMGVVELAKSVVSVKSPVSGVVRVINEAVMERPERVFADPMGAGWLLEVEARDWEGDAAQLVTGEAAEAAMREWARLNRIEWP